MAVMINARNARWASQDTDTGAVSREPVVGFDLLAFAGGGDARAASDNLEPAGAAPTAESTPVIAEKSEPNDFFDQAQAIDRSLFAIAPNPNLPDDSRPSVAITPATPLPVLVLTKQ